MDTTEPVGPPGSMPIRTRSRRPGPTAPTVAARRRGCSALPGTGWGRSPARLREGVPQPVAGPRRRNWSGGELDPGVGVAAVAERVLREVLLLIVVGAANEVPAPAHARICRGVSGGNRTARLSSRRSAWVLLACAVFVPRYAELHAVGDAVVGPSGATAIAGGRAVWATAVTGFRRGRCERCVDRPRFGVVSLDRLHRALPAVI
jgi:hypothetical protein